MDQLHMHYTSAIHNTAFTIVLGYVELYSGTGSTNFQKKQYSDLCEVSKYIQYTHERKTMFLCVCVSLSLIPF